MRSIRETPQSLRYFTLHNSISTAGIQDIFTKMNRPAKAEGVTISKAVSKVQDAAGADHLMAFFSSYAYADVPLETTFNYAFDLNNGTVFKVNLKLAFAVMVVGDLLLPVTYAQDGHKHFMFFTGHADLGDLPELSTIDTVAQEPKIGLCQAADWARIHSRLQTELGWNS